MSFCTFFYEDGYFFKVFWVKIGRKIERNQEEKLERNQEEKSGGNQEEKLGGNKEKD